MIVCYANEQGRPCVEVFSYITAGVAGQFNNEVEDIIIGRAVVPTKGE